VIALKHSLTGGTAVLLALLVGLTMTVGLGLPGWLVGVGSGALVSLAIGRGLVATGASTLGPADVVTLTRVTLACGLAAVVADSVVGSSATGATRPTLVVVAVVALLLDAVDGRTARRTGTCSAFGARFDGEADAFLIMVLSVYVAASVGGWVLSLGAARYLFGAAGWCLPWLRGQLPPRYWRKVVAAVQGVVLTWAAAGVAPQALVAAGLALALVLLSESFGRDVLWLWRHRAVTRDRTDALVRAPAAAPVRAPVTAPVTARVTASGSRR
jgi:phosphatidylglycerophosphate synthase